MLKYPSTVLSILESKQFGGQRKQHEKDQEHGAFRARSSVPGMEGQRRNQGQTRERGWRSMLDLVMEGTKDMLSCLDFKIKA